MNTDAAQPVPSEPPAPRPDNNNENHQNSISTQPSSSFGVMVSNSNFIDSDNNNNNHSISKNKHAYASTASACWEDPNGDNEYHGRDNYDIDSTATRSNDGTPTLIHGTPTSIHDHQQQQSTMRLLTPRRIQSNVNNNLVELTSSSPSFQLSSQLHCIVSSEDSIPLELSRSEGSPSTDGSFNSSGFYKQRVVGERASSTTGESRIQHRCPAAVGARSYSSYSHRGAVPLVESEALMYHRLSVDVDELIMARSQSFDRIATAKTDSVSRVHEYPFILFFR